MLRTNYDFFKKKSAILPFDYETKCGKRKALALSNQARPVSQLHLKKINKILI